MAKVPPARSIVEFTDDELQLVIAQAQELIDGRPRDLSLTRQPLVNVHIYWVGWETMYCVGAEVLVTQTGQPVPPYVLAFVAPPAMNAILLELYGQAGYAVGIDVRNDGRMFYILDALYR